MTSTSKETVVENKLVEITVDGVQFSVLRGISLAHALYSVGIRTLRRSTHQRDPRGMFCSMGVCFECTLTVDGNPSVRACMVTVQPGMMVETG